MSSNTKNSQYAKAGDTISIQLETKPDFWASGSTLNFSVGTDINRTTRAFSVKDPTKTQTGATVTLSVQT